MNATPEPDERLNLPSASALAIAVACPGQPNLKRSLPVQAFAVEAQTPANEWAERGERIHKAFETGNTMELAEDELDDYNKGVAFLDRIITDWKQAKGIEVVAEGPREVRVWLHHPLTLEPLCSAKPDRHFLAPPHMLVADLKTGWNPNLPPSAKSWQLKLQAIALLTEEYADLGINSVRVAYVQPKAAYSAINDVCDYTQEDLQYSLQSIQFHVWEAAQPNAPRHAGQHCNWCPCKAWCPEAAALSMLPAATATAAAEVVGLDQLDPAVIADQMTLPQLFKVVDNGTIIGKIIDACDARAKTLPVDVLQQFGYMLPEHGRKMDSIDNVAEAFKLLTATFLVEDVLTCMKFVREPLVELVKREMKLSKADAEKWIVTKLESTIKKGFAKPSLKRIQA